MTGDATTTLLLTVRAGALLSPARMATYSKPDCAPNIICAKIARKNRLNTGFANGTGSQCVSECRDIAQMGKAIRIAKTLMWHRPPRLCSHLPRLSPRTAAKESARSKPHETANAATFCSGNQAAAGPTMYATVVGIVYRTSAMTITA